MVDSDIQHEPDVDNWFDEPDTSGALDERSARLARSKQHESPAGERGADWAVADTAPTTGERLPIRVPEMLRNRRAVLVAALVLVACLLGGLAAAGVFSGSSRHATTTPPATTGAPATTTTPQVTPTQPALAAPAAPLKPGDQGAAVKELQRTLAHLGYSPGTIDGQYGPATISAVSSFQRASGLTADGILGANTLRALARALKTG